MTETEQGWEIVQGVVCVVCPACAFTFDMGHVDDDGTGRHSCPNCQDDTPSPRPAPGYRVRAVVLADTGLRHPDVGPLVAYDRRLSYHPTPTLARRRFDKILAEHGLRRQDGDSYIHTRVAWIEASTRDTDDPDVWHPVLRETPPGPEGWVA